MALDWTDTLDLVDWDALSALYKVAPLGDKPAANLKIVFSNSRYRCFVSEHGRRKSSCTRCPARSRFTANSASGA